MKIFTIVIPALLILGGCVAPVSQSNLYWGDYSQTLYKVKKEPGESSNRVHEKELLSIVEKSKELNLKVPPGVYAELGIFSMERGDNNAATNFFRMEQESYPEGAILMKRTLDLKPSES